MIKRKFDGTMEIVPDKSYELFKPKQQVPVKESLPKTLNTPYFKKEEVIFVKGDTLKPYHVLNERLNYHNLGILKDVDILIPSKDTKRNIKFTSVNVNSLDKRHFKKPETAGILLSMEFENKHNVLQLKPDVYSKGGIIENDYINNTSRVKIFY